MGRGRFVAIFTRVGVYSEGVAKFLKCQVFSTIFSTFGIIKMGRGRGNL